MNTTDKMRTELELRERLNKIGETNGAVQNHLMCVRIGEWTFFEMLLRLAVYQAEENAELRKKVSELFANQAVVGLFIAGDEQ